MGNKQNDKLDQSMQSLEKKLPDPISKFLRWLRTPSSRWARIPMAILLVAGGIFGFLPALGFWMVPLGLLLLAQDLPFLRKPTTKILVWIEQTWTKLKRGRAKS